MEIEEIVEKYTRKQIEDMTTVEFFNLLGYIKIEKEPIEEDSSLFNW